LVFADSKRPVEMLGGELRDRGVPRMSVARLTVEVAGS